MIELTGAAMRQMFPNAPQAVLDAFVSKQNVLTNAGINKTRNRMAYFFANIEHECGGFTIRNLTENINYTAERMAAVWPNRFNSASAVRLKYGTAPGWQKKAFDDIYGSKTDKNERMGNRVGTSDGSLYIGRGGPQVTGRDGYAQVGKRAGLDLVGNPDLACEAQYQPEICAAFWDWKQLNIKADAGDFEGCVRLWNGGTNGMADRKAMMAGNDPIIKKLAIVADIVPVINAIPTKQPVPSVVPPVIPQPTFWARITSIFGKA
ncbi:glycosyl hydrolase [Tardiphaga sp. 709]|uniref:glycoside hydrolase family 19 protein n=1 Tax=Tardiphaga sp. 709 TaxID=3076039 RepID=UPI0028E608E5|nr:glycosyl hydrolase [Tardiphaga sp. 709]WNV09943.1 glycosyl hydrolase [Tardiphaga sp. 709]